MRLSFPFLFDEGKPSRPFCFGGKKKSDDFFSFPLSTVFFSLQMQSNKYIVTQIKEK